MKQLWTVLGVIVLFVLIIAGTVIGKYNMLVTLNESIKGSWAEVENQLQRRNDLIPNLVSTVKGYAKHEKSIFEDVANARAKLGGAKTVGEKIQASQGLDSALSRLLAIVENYPNLKANENFIRLHDELAGTENRLAVARQRYNNVVLAYNVQIQRFPGNIVAAMFGFQKKDVYYQATEKAKTTVPNVEF